MRFLDISSKIMDLNIANIVKALVYTENGGKPKEAKAGKSGEVKSYFQFLQPTWKEYSKQVSGQDNLPLNKENEVKVVYAKVSDWLNHGYSPEQIFSMWNSGRPNAYKQGVKGVNKSGVAYDTPGYVKKATNYLSQFEKETKNPQQESPIVKSNQGMIKPTQPQEGMITSNPMKQGLMKEAS